MKRIIALALVLALVALLRPDVPVASVQTAPADQTDLSISLEPSYPILAPRQRVVWNFRVENHSRVLARNVTATVALPQGFRFEHVFSSGFWETCTLVNATWSAYAVTCTKRYFEAGRYTYISIPASGADLGWPYGLSVWGAVGSDTVDHTPANNWFALAVTIQ